MFDAQKLLAENDPKDLAKLVLGVLSWIGNIALPATGSSAMAVITAIKVVISSLLDYQKGTVTAEQVERDMAKLLDALKSTDEKIDAQLRKLAGKV